MRIDIAGWARETNAGGHRALTAIYEHADALGFDAVWLNEFHFRRNDPGYPSPLLLAADVLARTARLRIGFSVLVLPLYHPLMLAEQLAQLDYQSGGRIDVGVSRGTDPATFHALGLSPESGRQRFDEALAILKAAWTEPKISAAGPTFAFTDVAVGPPPVQQPHPPLYMAAVSPESIGRAVTEAMPLLYSLEPPEGRQIGVLRDLLKDGDPHRLAARSSFSRHVVVAETAAQAEALVDHYVASIGARRERLARERGTLANFVPTTRERFLSEQAVAGTPDVVAAQIRAASAATGSESLRCVFNANGWVGDDVAVPGMELFGREVLPLLRAR